MTTIGSKDCNGLLRVPEPIAAPSSPRLIPSSPGLIPSSPGLSPSLPPVSRPSSLWRLSSLDMLLDYNKACSEEKRLTQYSSTQDLGETSSLDVVDPPAMPQKQFRCLAAEIGFSCSMIITQLLAEYLISGFSVLLPELKSVFHITGPSSYWPASILSLLVCSTILTFARVSDMHGGYPLFMSALLLLLTSSIIAGLTTSPIILNISRGAQGLSLAAATPASYALIGTLYLPGPRRNLILGLCAASAPLGFFAGICTSAALPSYAWPWYFWTAAALALLALSLAYLSIPSNHSSQRQSHSPPLTMDWAGSATISTSLILLAYALSASTPSTWSHASILAPFLLGLALLAAAIYIEARIATAPLLPASFFAPRSVSAFCVAALALHAAFGTFLFSSTAFLSSVYGVSGLRLATYYIPLVVGGVGISVAGGAVLHRVPITLCLLLSALAWVGANLLLAFAEPANGYWAGPFPAMLCATVGIDGCFTVGSVFLSSVTGRKGQGLAGAVGSLLVNGGGCGWVGWRGGVEWGVGTRGRRGGDGGAAEEDLEGGVFVWGGLCGGWGGGCCGVCEDFEESR